MRQALSAMEQRQPFGMDLPYLSISEFEYER